MDARTGFAAGGFIVGATAVAVACVVTLTNSTALADVPGRSAGLDVVRVSPSGAQVSPTPRASGPAASAPDISAPAPSPSAELVPAPEPRDVSAPPASTSAPAAPAAPKAPAVPAAPAPAAPVQPDYLGLSKSEIQDEALRTGSWDRLRAWAAADGWSQERIEHWISVLQGKTSVNKDSARQTYLTQTPADAGTETGRSPSGSKRAQSPQPPRGD
jgi:hypothetical protein